MLNWSRCPAVESIPDRVHGAWVFRGTRLPVALVFECLGKGATAQDIVDWYGGVSREQVEQVIAFVSDTLEDHAHAGPV